MNKTPRISETEWKIMKMIWTLAPCSASQIIEALVAEDSDWHPRTVKAFLNRLVHKKALGFRKEGRSYLYRPLVAEKDCVDIASKSFLDSVFGGSLQPMLAHFVEHKKLSDDDIRELRRILKNESGKGN